MSLEITLPPEVEKRLRERAAALGLDLQAYATQLLEEALNPRRSFEERRAEIYQRFLASGTTDDQLGEELEKAKHEMRAERRARQGA
jgi:hypothetical protein